MNTALDNITRIASGLTLRAAAANFAALGLAAVLTAAPAPATAEPGGNAAPRQVVVQYGDLNLRNARSVEVLYRRIRTAADEACSTLIYRAPQQKACVASAIDRAVGDIDLPTLTAYHDAKVRGVARTPGQVAAK